MALGDVLADGGGAFPLRLVGGLLLSRVFPLPPPRHSGVLSAYGLALADIVHEAQEPCSLVYGPASFAQLDLRTAALEETCLHALEAQGFARWAPGLGGQEGAGGLALAPGAEDVKPLCPQVPDHHRGLPAPALRADRLRPHVLCQGPPGPRRLLQPWRLWCRLCQ